MPGRYAISGLSGYIAFLALLSVYIAWKRRMEGFDLTGDALDLGSHSLPSRAPGTGGASEAWNEPGTGNGGSWLDGFDDLGWIVLALAAACAGLIAVVSIVWAAPTLLAEVLVDAVIVSRVSRYLADSDRRDWTATAIRRTWIPATVVVVALVVGGWALQQAAPEATSIGPALRTLSGR